jgi:hypothetical protein
MPDYNEIFSGIPSLDDEAGVQNYMNNAALADAGLGNVETPAALQTQNQTAEPQAQTTEPVQTAPQYTSDQIAAIIARNQQLEAANQQAAARAMSQQQQMPQQTYTPRQAAIIKQLIDRGVSLDRINAALQSNRQQTAAQDAMMSRLANVERYLQEQEYTAAQNAFVDKMTTFGNRFGLSENDLVTFGNKAMSMGINLTEVPSDAIENVFKAVYPDQYAIRSQRLSGASASHIYGGASSVETTRASASKLEDAYVDAFLKQSMPNQYGKYTK